MYIYLFLNLNLFLYYFNSLVKIRFDLVTAFKN